MGLVVSFISIVMYSVNESHLFCLLLSQYFQQNRHIGGCNLEGVKIGISFGVILEILNIPPLASVFFF